jgi:N-acetylglucosaminyl-diphospho-decaprenol L-rhamnosyltransferase
LSSLIIIIVNWNSGDQLKACLHSIVEAERTGFDLRKVVVIDNNSSDDSLKATENFNLPLQVVKNKSNLGFGKACNQGAALAQQTDYLLFLNPDARLFKTSLSQALFFMQEPQNRQVGICGVQLLDDNGQVSRTCARFPEPSLFWVEMTGLDHLLPKRFVSRHMRDWTHTENCQVDHVIGAFFLIRTALFEQLNGFDEDYYVYLEDLDLSYRSSKLGYSSYYLASVQAYHKGGGSSEKVKAKRLFYSLRSRIQYGYKHFDPANATILAIATLFIEPLSRIAFSVLKGSLQNALETVQAFAYLWLSIPAWFKNTNDTNN